MKLQKVLNQINNEYEETIYKNFAITLGDEFQALFSDFKYVLEIISIIQIKMWPIKIRFGIGFEDLFVNLSDKSSPYNSDGPCWWNAREAINLIKTNNSKNSIYSYSNVVFISNNPRIDELINTSLDLCYTISNNWTDKQRILIFKIIELNGLTDKFNKTDLAKHFNQSNSTIYSKLSISKYYNYLRIYNKITQYLRSL